MQLIELYQRDVDANVISYDGAQVAVIPQLQTIIDQLHERQSSWWSLFKKRYRTPVLGLYLWGSVGIGKTYLLDLFYQSLTTKRKHRAHFHLFMRHVHQELTRVQGKANPLELVAQKFAQQFDVLCLDEFFVVDITDAMLLANLLQALFSRGITLVTTSNTMPQQLYKDGLQRTRFLPAIDLLARYTCIAQLASVHDYRLQTLTRSGVFFSPLSNESANAMRKCFVDLTHHSADAVSQHISVNDREITTLGYLDGIIWFDFVELCQVPRSQLDYLEIATAFHTVLLSNVPRLAAEQIDKVTYLIWLVDVLYDNQVKLVMSSEVPIDEIYVEGIKQLEFERSKSRLIEMQSHEYLRRPRLHG